MKTPLPEPLPEIPAAGSRVRKPGQYLNSAPTDPPLAVRGSPDTTNPWGVAERDAAAVLDLKCEKFREQLLCDGIAFSPSAGGAGMVVPSEVNPVAGGDDHPFPALLARENRPIRDTHEVAMRRQNVTELLKAHLLHGGTSRYSDPLDTRTVFGSTRVDVAANIHVLKETAEACNLIFKHTHWQVRLVSKSSLLDKLVADNLVPGEFHLRLILGFSMGTLDDRVARAIESGTPAVSQRLKSLHWLQDEGVRTFGMISPSLPQNDYFRFSREICDAIRVERCEHVWAAVLGRSREPLKRVIDGLRRAGMETEAQAVREIGDSKSGQWEPYARATFQAHAEHVPATKLRFLQPVDADSASYWAAKRGQGAVLLGKIAKRLGLTAAAPTAVRPSKRLADGLPLASEAPVNVAPPAMTDADTAYRMEREQIVSTGVRASIAAAKALFEIHSYKNGLLWRKDFKSFQAYCRARWDYSKPHAYRLVECGDFVVELEQKSPIGDCLPQTENQIRPLLAFPKETRVEVWKAVTAKMKPGQLTGRAVAERAMEHARAKHIPLRSKAANRPSQAQAIAGALSRLRAATNGHRLAKRIAPLIGELEFLLSEKA